MVVVAVLVVMMLVVQDKYGYERELMVYLADLVVACDRRVSLTFVPPTV